jgi:hypothetical protein
MITIVCYRTQYPYVECMHDYGCMWRMYEDASKNEVTWCRMFAHYRCQIRYSLKSIRGAVAQMTFCTLVRNSDSNLNVPYLYENDGKVVLNWNWLDNNWNGNNPALRFATHFTPHPALAGLSFAQLSIPTSEHLANLFYLQRDSSIFFSIQRFCFP